MGLFLLLFHYMGKLSAPATRSHPSRSLPTISHSGCVSDLPPSSARCAERLPSALCAGKEVADELLYHSISQGKKDLLCIT